MARGSTLIGRSAECHVTIEDPLVSRQHAKIVINADGAAVEDLGSRNGIKVNGMPAKGPTRLKDGDRIRIGTQDLVFCEIPIGATSVAKTTGFLRYCASCRLPYPQELAACPACGATEQTDEETLNNGQFGTSARQASWSVQLLVEVTEKALALNRNADAERMLQRAKLQLEERVAAGGEVGLDQVEMLARSAVKVAMAAGDPAWAAWAMRLYGELRHFPSAEVMAAIREVGKRFAAELLEPAEDLLSELREREGTRPSVGEIPPGDSERASLAAWDELVGTLAALAEAGKKGDAAETGENASNVGGTNSGGSGNPANPNLS